MTKFSLSFTLSALLASFASAQQTLTFGVTPGQTTTGGGSLGVVVGGHGTTPISVPPGTSSLGVANAMAAALLAGGFTVQQNGTEVTVTSGPGGAPLQNGGGIGSTDPGITGIKAKVHKAPPGAPPGANPPGNKVNGGAVKKAAGAGQAQGPGTIQIDVEVMKLIGGVWTLMWIQVQIPVQPGDDAQAVNNRVRQQLENQGLKVNDITLPPSIQPITPIPCMGIDRTLDGFPVEMVQMQLSGSALQLWPEFYVGAGQFPIGGPTDYDTGLDPFGVEAPLFLEYNGDSFPGGFGTFDCFVQPGTIGSFMIGFGNAQAPWQAQVIPLPFIGPDFYSLLDPFSSVSLLSFPDPLGHMQLPLTLPPDPTLGGMTLMLQGLTIDPGQANPAGSVHRSNGLRLAIE